MFLLSPSSQSYLSVRGAAEALEDGRITDPAAVAAALKAAFPGTNADPAAPDTLAWLSAATDCLTAMNEQLYEHYRPVVDLFRSLVYGVGAIPSLPVWSEALRTGESLGLLLRADLAPDPHPFAP